MNNVFSRQAITPSFLKLLIAALCAALVLVVDKCDVIAADQFVIASQQSLEDADKTTHEIKSGEVILGISETGGGYINKLFIPGVGDIISKHAGRYGRGGQVTIRDRLHKGRYNPTQAGFTDRAGTICLVEKPIKDRLVVPPRPCSLWNGDSKYDFTEWENLAADPYRQDKGNSDSDGLDESMLVEKQATEITSEFDFTAAYENFQDGEKITIPAFRLSFEFRFIRPPGHCLKQFRKGTPAYKPAAEIADRSRFAPPGDHPSTEDSLTAMILSSTLRGDKSVWDPKYTFVVNEKGELYGRDTGKNIRHVFYDKSQSKKLPLIIFSTSKAPDSGPAIGYFFPYNHVNRLSIVGRSMSDHSIVYEDERTTLAFMLGNVARTPYMWLFGVRTNLTGLLNTKETPANTYEAIRGESYILIGTPNEIFDAANLL